MKHDVNYILLGLLLVVIIAMIAMLFYYNVTYGMLSQRYESAVRDVENKSAELNRTLFMVVEKDAMLREKEQILLDYIQNLNLSKERETSLGSFFTEVKSRNEVLDDQLNATRSERNSYATLYNRYYADYGVCVQDKSSLTTQVNSANNKIGAMRTGLAEISTKIGYVKESADSITGMAQDLHNNRYNSSAIGGLANDIAGDAGSIKGQSETIKTIADRLKNL